VIRSAPNNVAPERAKPVSPFPSRGVAHPVNMVVRKSAFGPRYLVLLADLASKEIWRRS